MPIHRAPADHTVHTKVREMGRLRRQTDRHAHRRSCSGHSGAPPTTDPLSAHLGPPWQPKVQHIHLDQLRRQLLAAEDLCSDLAAGAVIAIPRQLHCPSDGGEGGLPALRAASQPRASHPFEELTQLKIFLASCEDVALARTPSKGRDDFARPVAVAGQEGRRACPRAPEGRAKGRRAAEDRGQSGCHGTDEQAGPLASDRMGAQGGCNQPPLALCLVLV